MTDETLQLVRERMRGILKRNRTNYKSPRFDTSDILQDSLVQIATQTPGGQIPDEKICQKWLQMVTLGHLAKYLRFNRASKRSVEHETGLAQFHGLERPSMDPAGLCAHREVLEKMLQAMEQLDAHQRQLVTLRFFEQLTYDEIAERTKIAVHRVRSGLTQSLKQLRDQIGAEDVGET